MCVSMYSVYITLCMYVHIPVCMYYVCVCMYSVCTYLYVCMYYVHIPVCMCVHIMCSTCMYVHLYVHTLDTMYLITLFNFSLLIRQ